MGNPELSLRSRRTGETVATSTHALSAAVATALHRNLRLAGDEGVSAVSR
jgi:hypothetical protein